MAVAPALSDGCFGSSQPQCLSSLQVVGVNIVEVQDAESLVNFFAECFDNRAVGATKMNDRSSRSHAIYTVLINRTLVDVSEGGSKVGLWIPVVVQYSVQQ